MLLKITIINFTLQKENFISMTSILKKLLLLSSICLAGCVSNPGSTPLIGISPNGSAANYNDNSPMFTSVFKAGGAPLMLPMVRTESEAETVIAKIDGLIMVGGEDVHPSYYGEEVWNETVEVNGFRDTSDFLIIKAARKKGIPILGICRGEQILNVALGGSLYQDLPSQHGEHVAEGVHEHMLFIEKGSRLHKLLGTDSIQVNTWHHQAVKVPAEGMTVTAHAHDGIIEAYEGDGIFAIQFHPEKNIAEGDYRFLPIFQDFVRQAR